MAQTKNRTRRMIDGAREKIEATRERAEGIVKENPLTSVAVAAAVGALVAVGVSSFMRRERKSFLDKLRDYF